MSKIQYNSPVILTYALISFFVLLVSYATGGESNILLFSVYRTSFLDPLMYFRMLSHVFGHANVQHYLGNFMIILLIGPMLEEKYGSRTLILMIGFTAIVTGLLNVLLFKTALLGASGIAFMLILLSSFVNLKKGMIPLTFIFVVLIYVGSEVVSGLTSSDNISQLTHIVGGICGAGIGYFVNRRKLTDKEEVVC